MALPHATLVPFGITAPAVEPHHTIVPHGPLCLCAACAMWEAPCIVTKECKCKECIVNETDEEILSEDETREPVDETDDEMPEILFPPPHYPPPAPVVPVPPGVLRTVEARGAALLKRAAKKAATEKAMETKRRKADAQWMRHD